MHWNLLSAEIPQTLAELKTILLQNRHIDPESATTFFAPPSPLDLSLEDVGISRTETEKAIQRIFRARDNKEDVLIFGDYDADGICATAILWEGLKSIGLVARPFIPHREKHGYGLSNRSLDAVLAEKTPDLIITVDNGIVAHGAFARLRAAGIDAILTDHHQPESTLPDATAIVHTTQLCGSAVAWFLAKELNIASAQRSLDLAAIATITDQMPLLAANRAVVFHGLEALRSSERVGLQLLFAKANLPQEAVDANAINYGIGPRINAMGRIKHGMDALRLLCTKSVERAEELVNELNDTNTSRQELTSEMIDHALQSAAQWENENLIVVASTEYHEGVIGLIAGKLVEKFYKPAIVIAIGDGVAKASARSVVGVNIIDLIRLVKDDLLEAGGHPMAAGFGLLPEKIEVVKSRLSVIAHEQITKSMLEPAINVECLLSPQLVSVECCDMMEQFAPFGQQNREPVFGFQKALVAGAKTVGRENNHLRLGLRLGGEEGGQASAQTLTALAWGKGDLIEKIQQGSQVDVAGVMQINEWKGKKSVQLVVKDVTL